MYGSPVKDGDAFSRSLAETALSWRVKGIDCFQRATHTLVTKVVSLLPDFKQLSNPLLVLFSLNNGKIRWSYPIRLHFFS